MLSRAILDQSFELTLFLRDWKGLESAFLGEGYDIRPNAAEAGRRMPVLNRMLSGRYVIVSGGDLGLHESISRATIYDLAHRSGLKECHPQAGWELMLVNKTLKLKIRDLLIGAKPIEMGPNFFLLFEVRSGQTMAVDAGDKSVEFREGREWLFEVA